MAPPSSPKPVARSLARIALGVLASLLVLVILWLDITTGVWENLVILSGLAAGLVSFVFTVLVLNRIVVRNAAHRWSTVNRLAFSEFLHTLADDELSEIARGEIVARTLSIPDELYDTVLVGFPGTAGSTTEPVSQVSGTNEIPAHAHPDVPAGSLAHIGRVDHTAPVAALLHLREQIVVERALVSDVLSRWAQFLSSSGDNDAVLQHLAAIAWQFDVVRDAALDAEREWSPSTQSALRREVDLTNHHLASLVTELQERLRR